MLTLNSMLQQLQHTTLTVELRDDTLLTGSLEEVDQYMNLTLSDVEIAPGDGGGEHQRQEMTHVKGTSIQCVHLPENVNAAQVLVQRLRQADQGASAFRQRVKKPASESERLPRERLEPLVSARVTEAVEGDDD